jgi:uncharacterized protein YjiS (DUF1127 family)
MFAQLKEAVEKYKIYRQTMRELGGLTDRELNDLAIGRSDIAYVARTAAYGDQSDTAAVRGVSLAQNHRAFA